MILQSAGKVLWRSLVASLMFQAGSSEAAITPHGLFTDNMVLQQGIKAPVWGTTDKPHKVTVSLQGQDVSAVPQDGKWRVEFAPLKSGGPFTLAIAQGDDKLELKDVLVGEVWICGGQSNMQFSVRQSAEAKEAIASAGNEKIRLITIPRRGSAQVKTDVKAHWDLCSPKTVEGFSAVGYYFGRELEKQRAVPIGLINSNVGGTPAESWASLEALQSDPDLEGYAKAEKSSKLYNAMIAPLAPFAIRGAIWYQGESNVGQAYLYRKLLPTMIKSWRDTFRQGDFPFLIVQIAPYLDIKKEPGPSSWAELRDAQLHTSQTVPNTAQVVITDIGEEKDIHPPKKEPVGVRLALAARAIAYGEKIEYSGPLYDKMTASGDKAILSFKHASSGLVSRPLSAALAKRLDVDPQALCGFTIAGEDQQFHTAQAKIEGDQVVVSSAKVARPVAVRFGWADYPVVNLWNKDGLPATPFRTDSFELTTQSKK